MGYYYAALLAHGDSCGAAGRAARGRAFTSSDGGGGGGGGKDRVRSYPPLHARAAAGGRLGRATGPEPASLGRGDGRQPRCTAAAPRRAAGRPNQAAEAAARPARPPCTPSAFSAVRPPRDAAKREGVYLTSHEGSVGVPGLPRLLPRPAHARRVEGGRGVWGRFPSSRTCLRWRRAGGEWRHLAPHGARRAKIPTIIRARRRAPPV